MKQNTQTTNLKQCIPHYDTHQSYDPQYTAAALQSTVLSPGHHKISHITSNIYSYFRLQTVKPVDFAHNTRHYRPSSFPVCRPIRLMCRYPTILSLSPMGISTPGLVAQQEVFQNWSSERALFRVCPPKDSFTECPTAV